MVYCSSN